MAQEVARIKKRIKSVGGSYKITSAMKLVSTVKLKKWKNKMLANKEYSLRRISLLQVEVYLDYQQLNMHAKGVSLETSLGMFDI